MLRHLAEVVRRVRELGRHTNVQARAEFGNRRLKLFLVHDVEQERRLAARAAGPRDVDAEEQAALLCRMRAIRQVLTCETLNKKLVNAPELRRKGPTKLLRAVTGSLVCAISTYLSAISPSTVGGRLNSVCQKSCSSRWRCMTYASSGSSTYRTSERPSGSNLQAIFFHEFLLHLQKKIFIFIFIFFFTRASP